MEVEAIQDDLQLREIFCCDCITPHNVTEVKERAKHLTISDGHGQHRSKIDLLCNKYS